MPAECRHETGEWVERSVDLSVFTGQTVDLVFQVETDSSLNSNWFIDDVSLKSTGRSRSGDLLSPSVNNQKPDVDRETLLDQFDKSKFGLGYFLYSPLDTPFFPIQ
jgi:hypothetical protein